MSSVTFINWTIMCWLSATLLIPNEYSHGIINLPFIKNDNINFIYGRNYACNVFFFIGFPFNKLFPTKMFRIATHYTYKSLKLDLAIKIIRDNSGIWIIKSFYHPDEYNSFRNSWKKIVILHTGKQQIIFFANKTSLTANSSLKLFA